MKILQIAPPWLSIPPQNYGGTEWIIANLIKELDKQGHQVTLFATGNSQTAAELKYVYDTGLFEQNDAEWSLMQPALALPALVHYDQAFKEAASGKYDIVHAHLSAGTDLMKLKFLSELTVPYLATTHMIFPFDKWSNKDDEYVKYYARDIRLVFISQTQSQLYSNDFYKLGVVHNSLDLSLHQFQAEPKGYQGQPYLTWLGKIMPWKGLDVAIEVAKRADMRLIFAGVLDETNHPESKVYFKEKVEPYIDGDQIQFVGPADLKLKNELLGNATAFLNPISWSEPFGMVVIEALACGTPVVSFNRGGAKEIISHGQVGYLTDSQDQMLACLSQIDQLERHNCRRHVEEHFSAQSMTNQYLKLYHRSIADHHSRQLTDMIGQSSGPTIQSSIKLRTRSWPSVEQLKR